MSEFRDRLARSLNTCKHPNMRLNMHPMITVAIPTLPARGMLLERAIRSVRRQTLPAAAISVAADVSRAGAAATRQRALDAVLTPWVALLDDDDAFKAEHLEKLYRHAIETD